MASDIKHFLLVYDHDQQKLIDVQEFGTDRERAVAAYSAKEQEIGNLGGASALEIVLIGSDSFETVQLTHANYFGGTASKSKYLVGLT